MATWNEIKMNPVFVNATPEQKEEMREQFFESKVAPTAMESGIDVEAAREHFYSSSQDDFVSPVSVETDVDGMAQVPQVSTQTPVEPEEKDTSILGYVGKGLDVINDYNPAHWLMNKGMEATSEYLRGDSEETVEAKAKSEAPITFDDSEPFTFDEISDSKEFASESAYEKRRIAKAYFDKFETKGLPPEEYDVELDRFNRAYGLGKIDSSVEAKDVVGIGEQTGEAVDRSIKWLFKSGDEKIADLKAAKQQLSEGGSSIKDFMTGENTVEVLSAAGAWLVDTGSNAIDIGIDLVSGMSDEEFERQNLVPKSQAREYLSAIGRNKFERELAKQEGVNLEAAKQGDEVKDIDVTNIRETAEQEVTDLGRDAIVDIGSVFTGVGAAKKATDVLSFLSKAPRTVEALGMSAGAMGGQATRNLLDEENVAKGVLQAGAADLGFTALTSQLGNKSVRSNVAAKSVDSGEKKFNQILQDSADLDKVAGQKDRAVRGLALDMDSLKPLKTFDEAAHNAYSEVNKAYKSKNSAMRFSELEDAYNQLAKEGDVDLGAFLRATKSELNIKGKFKPTLAESWLRIRKGEFDNSIAVMTETHKKKLLDELQSGDVSNYIRAREMGDMKGVSGWIGRALTDVSDTAGAGLLGRTASGVSNLTDIGLTSVIKNWARDKATAPAQKSAMDELLKGAKDAAEGAKGVQEAMDKNVNFAQANVRSKLGQAQDMMKAAREAQDKTLNSRKDMEKQAELDVGESISDVYKAEQRVAEMEYAERGAKEAAFRARRDLSAAKQELLDADREVTRLRNSEADNIDVIEALSRKSEARAAVQQAELDAKNLQKIHEDVQLEVQGAKDAIDPAIAARKDAKQAKKDVQTEFDKLVEMGESAISELQSKLRNQGSVVAGVKRKGEEFKLGHEKNLGNWEALNKLSEKGKLTDKDVLSAGSPIKDPAMFQKQPSPELTNAVATLAGRARRKAGESALSAKHAINWFLMTTLGLPMTSFKVSVSIINSMANKNQKRGLIGGIKAIDKHMSGIKKLEADLKGTDKKSPEYKAKEEALAKAVEAYNTDLNKAGDTTLKQINRVLKEAERLSLKQFEEDEE